MGTTTGNPTDVERAALRHDAKQALKKAKRHAESAADLYEQAGDQVV